MALWLRLHAGARCHAADRMNLKKILGLVAFFIAIGMLIMLLTHNRLVGLIIIALLLFVGYNCICGD